MSITRWRKLYCLRTQLLDATAINHQRPCSGSPKKEREARLRDALLEAGCVLTNIAKSSAIRVRMCCIGLSTRNFAISKLCGLKTQSTPTQIGIHYILRPDYIAAHRAPVKSVARCWPMPRASAIDCRRQRVFIQYLIIGTGTKYTVVFSK